MKNLFLLLLLISPFVAFSQEEIVHEFPRLRLEFEASGGFLNGSTQQPNGVRQNQTYYHDSYYEYDLYYCGFMYSYQTVSFVALGVKPEYSLNNSITVAVGLRMMYGHSRLTSDRDYFLWKVAEDGLETNYIRVKNVTQNNFFLGFPVEIKVFFHRRDLPVRAFATAGVNLDLLLASQTTPYFENKRMEKYATEIKHQIPKVNAFVPTAFVGAGLKIRRMHHPFGSIELQIPFCVSKHTISSFLKSDGAGMELKGTFYLPIGKQKIGYTYIDD
jgi:hypothetical protein